MQIDDKVLEGFWVNFPEQEYFDDDFSKTYKITDLNSWNDVMN